MKKGKFVVLEGVGGAGKSEQIKKISDYLKSKGVNFVATREPGGVQEAEQVRSLIFAFKRKRIINSDHETALFFAARKIWMENVVIPSIKSGFNVISDRTYFSTAAYQGFAGGVDVELIEKMSKVVIGKYKPDLVILLDVSLKTALMRNSANKEGDPFDYLSKKFFQKVINGYRKMAKEGWGGVKWEVIDAENSIEDVFRIVRKSIDKIVLSS